MVQRPLDNYRIQVSSKQTALTDKFPPYPNTNCGSRYKQTIIAANDINAPGRHAHKQDFVERP